MDYILQITSTFRIGWYNTWYDINDFWKEKQPPAPQKN